MYIEIPKDVLAGLLAAAEGSDADAMWSYVCEDIPEISLASYEEREHYFLSVLYRLMHEGRVKLAADGKFLEGTIEEQVQRYSNLWPKDEAELCDFNFQLIQNPVDRTLYCWVEGCFVWIYQYRFMDGLGELPH